MEQAAMAYDACARLAREVIAAHRLEQNLRRQLKAMIETVDDALEDGP